MPLHSVVTHQAKKQQTRWWEELFSTLSAYQLDTTPHRQYHSLGAPGPFDNSNSPHVVWISYRFLPVRPWMLSVYAMRTYRGGTVKQAAIRTFALFFVMNVLLMAAAAAQDVASFEKRTTVKTLPNGLTILICERPEAPVFSFYTLVDTGSVQDPMGKTGLAHMFEHMAFKGTGKIGTTDYPAEKAALAKVETAYAAYIQERDKPLGADKQKLEQLEKAWKDAIADGDKYVKPNEFDTIVDSNGGENMNASTSDDSTQYFYSFPSNRLELWAYLESERFLHPVMREFYKERNVVIEE